MSSEMTRAERHDLLVLARKREKVAKTEAEARAAELLADFEHQMASIYHWDDSAVWSEAHRIAKEAQDKANAMIAEECQERLGIPANYAPRIETAWRGRGENASKDRQAELRRVASARIDEITKTAKHQIEASSATAQERIIATGLASEARKLLTEIPSPEQLMPTLDMQEIESAVTQPKAVPGFPRLGA
jgi:hypothetical protein